MVNVNIGLLGHVDSGKTSLAKALSCLVSTAAFDKSPQSQSRGITLDLGFSACEITPHYPGCASLLNLAGLEHVTCTLVDCPGHASLIRTIVGGAQIIDVMVLLIDATKGIQPQTSECIVLGEVLVKPLLVVINKVDAIQGSSPMEKAAALGRLRRRLALTFAQTRWPNVTMVEVATAPRFPIGGSTGGDSATGFSSAPYHVELVLPAALSLVDLAGLRDAYVRCADRSEDFVMLIDHCFAVRGQGTVFTGTVLGGKVGVGQLVLIPELQVVRKVKDLQMFKKHVEWARRGDRIGLCVTHFDPNQMERGVLCHAPANVLSSIRTHTGNVASAHTHFSMPPMESAAVLVARVYRIRFHLLSCDSRTKFHITVGHSTVMGTMRFFSRATSAAAANVPAQQFNLYEESAYEEELSEESFMKFDLEKAVAPGQPLPLASSGKEFYAILLLETPIFVSVGSTFLAMRLDVERENFCRVALAGEVKVVLASSVSTCTMSEVGSEPPQWRTLPIVRLKKRTLHVDRVVDTYTCIADGLVGDHHIIHQTNGLYTERNKESLHTEAKKFVGLKVEFVPAYAIGLEGGKQEDKQRGEGDACVCGVIDSTFGKTGKVRVRFEKGVFQEDAKICTKKNVTKGLANDETLLSNSVFLYPGEIVLTIKKYPLATHATLQQ